MPLSHIFNLSLTTGNVPTNLKISKIIPVFKKGDPHQISNYRPISLLPCFSKILERIVYTRLFNHLNQYSLLNDCQYGFRPHYSCDLAVIDLQDRLMTKINNGLHTFGIFLDLSKAFDLINHEILLYKLSRFGIRGIPLQWFRSYLTKRTQCTSYNNHTSTFFNITSGIPQGSILGPLIFPLHINDLCNVYNF